MHRWAWQPKRGQGSAVGGGLAVAGWAEQEGWQAEVGAWGGTVRKQQGKGYKEQEAPRWGPCGCCRAGG